MNQRKDYISWDECFMGMARLAAMRSKDPNTQVGACIVSSDNRILSIGYNGAPNGMSDLIFPWNRDGSSQNTKYAYVVHAEANAIDNFQGTKISLKGAKIYVDLFPCNECAKRIIQNGISEVIYLSDKYKDTDATIIAKKMFDYAGVTYRQYKSDKNIELTLHENAKQKVKTLEK